MPRTDPAGRPPEAEPRESGLSRSIRALFEPDLASAQESDASSEVPRGAGPRDILTTLCARYIRGNAVARERLGPGIELQARLLSAAGEAATVADAVLALARIDEGRAAGPVPSFVTNLVDPQVGRALAERLALEPDPRTRGVLEGILSGSEAAVAPSGPEGRPDPRDVTAAERSPPAPPGS